MSESSIDVVIAEIIAQWRAENPTAHQIPRGVRKEVSRALREDAAAQRMDTEIARSQVSLEILHHQRAMAAGQRRPADQSDTEWAGVQQRLAAAAEALERRIHSMPGLSKEDRGAAVSALHNAHRNPDAPQRVGWGPDAGRPSLAARAVERLSAIRLGITVAAKAFHSTLFAAAQAEASQRAAAPSARDWLTPAQTAAVESLTAAARRFDQTSALARNGESAYLTVVVDDFAAALDHARRLGIPSERLDRELADVHRKTAATAAQQTSTGRWRAAAGPLTPPSSSRRQPGQAAPSMPGRVVPPAADQLRTPGRAR
ncbi:hypothetical protein [Nocardia thailandica]